MQRGKMASSQIWAITTIFSKCLFSLVNKFDSVDNSWSSFFDFHEDIDSRWFSGFTLIGSLVIVNIVTLTLRFDCSTLLHTFFLVLFSVTETFLSNFSAIFVSSSQRWEKKSPRLQPKGLFFVHTCEVLRLGLHNMSLKVTLSLLRLFVLLQCWHPEAAICARTVGQTDLVVSDLLHFPVAAAVVGRCGAAAVCVCVWGSFGNSSSILQLL